MSLILVATDGTCFCHCGVKCVLHRAGSEARCTKKELEDAGYAVVTLDSKDSDREVMRYMTIDGNKKALKIKCKKVK